jgi:hypothetical protein
MFLDLFELFLNFGDFDPLQTVFSIAQMYMKITILYALEIVGN